MKTEPKKDHSVKHKPEQEQTVGLTQVGTLHGELPDGDDAIANLRNQLHAYGKGCANLESELAHLRQENAELKAELLCKETEWAKIFESLKSNLHRHKNELEYWISKCALHKDALEKCREALAMAYEHVAGKADWFDFSLMEKALDCIKELSKSQPTQDHV